MKLRTNKNSIRFRLSQSELNEFRTIGVLQEVLCFSSRASERLMYSLIQADHDEISVSFINNHLRVYVPIPLAQKWCSGDEVGFECNIALGNDNYLYILVEKDFKCLTQRANEDESDNFPNPNSEAC